MVTTSSDMALARSIDHGFSQRNVFVKCFIGRIASCAGKNEVL